MLLLLANVLYVLQIISGISYKNAHTINYIKAFLKTAHNVIIIMPYPLYYVRGLLEKISHPLFSL
jgi:hypothetical protein